MAFATALTALVMAGREPAPPRPDHDALPPNIVVILTDDQSIDTLPTTPAAMPWLQQEIRNRNGHWLWFPNAFLNTPLCCPSRASILTGRYSHHTGVQGNTDGADLDESNTVATWLDDAGYATALIGKYLNRYPWDRGPYVPAGWDRWVGKRNNADDTSYENYQLIDQGVPLTVGSFTQGYATDFLAQEALAFLRAASPDRPYFLLFTPSAPHSPWTPARRHRRVFQESPVPEPSARVLNDVSGKPAWIRELEPITIDRRAELETFRRRERASLLAVDEAVRDIVSAIRDRGELDRTVIFFLTDNGYAFGEHRWVGKRCPYEECIRTPFAVHSPWADATTLDALVSNVDLAPTIAELAGTRPRMSVDGVSLARLLRAPGASRARRLHDRTGVLIEWDGDEVVPPWWGVRTANFVYIESLDGTVELYDLNGARGSPDPHELDNRARDRRYAGVRRRLAALLDHLRSRPGNAR